MSDTCRDCGRRVLYVGTVRGKRMAMDPQPDQVNGEYLLTHANSQNGNRLVVFLKALNDATRRAVIDPGGACLYKRHTCRERMERFERLKEAA